MIRQSPDFVCRRRHGQARWLALGVGLMLTLCGSENGAHSASNDAIVPALHESSPTQTPPHEADVLSPASIARALRGTIVFDKLANSLVSRTIIADSRGRQGVYELGDEISDGGKVVLIQRNFVILQRGDHLERLELSWNTVAQALGRDTPPPQGMADEMPAEDYPEVLRNAMLTRPALLLQLIGATPAVEGDHFLGYRVMKPEDPALLESLGLEPGDILTAVNGVPYNTQSDAIQLLNAMSGTGRLTFTVRRGNKIVAVN